MLFEVIGDPMVHLGSNSTILGKQSHSKQQHYSQEAVTFETTARTYQNETCIEPSDLNQKMLVRISVCRGTNTVIHRGGQHEREHTRIKINQWNCRKVLSAIISERRNEEKKKSRNGQAIHQILSSEKRCFFS